MTAKVARPPGHPSADMQILSMLRRSPGLTYTIIACRVSVGHASCERALARLIERGMIELRLITNTYDPNVGQNGYYIAGGGHEVHP
jgi:predicted transcriptional regulator